MNDTPPALCAPSIHAGDQPEAVISCRKGGECICWPDLNLMAGCNMSTSVRITMTPADELAAGPPAGGGQGDPIFLGLLDEIGALHRLKSGGYGTDTDAFANFTGVAAISGRHRFEYPVERMIEKLIRCQSLVAQGRLSELGEEFKDVASLGLCAEAMRRADLERPEKGGD